MRPALVAGFHVIERRALGLKQAPSDDGLRQYEEAHRGFHAAIIAEHKAILHAVLSRDADRAAAALSSHVPMISDFDLSGHEAGSRG